MVGVVRVKCHPTLGILVGNDGHVMVPANGPKKAHWTFGSNDGQGYLRVMIKGKNYKVHRLVLEAFVGPCPENKPEINHINRNRADNRLENLSFCSRSENMRNTSHNDRVDARGGTHFYENRKQCIKEWKSLHRNIRFSDGKRRYIPNADAIELLKLPVKERTWPI